MGRTAKSQQQARAKARQRRIVLDHDRAVRDERVEAAAGEVFLALAERADASGQIRTAEVRASDALQRILAEGIKADGVAQLCDLSVGEVHRLRRAAQTVQDSHGDADPASDCRHSDRAAPETATDLPHSGVGNTAARPRASGRRRVGIECTSGSAGGSAGRPGACACPSRPPSTNP